jgi:hypothetical protein
MHTHLEGSSNGISATVFTSSNRLKAIGVFDKPEAEDWSRCYGLGDSEKLVISKETDSSLEFYGRDTGSEIT